MLNLKSLLTREELAGINARLDAATWVDGRETASGPTRMIKNNRQVGIDDPLAHELGERITAALMTWRGAWKAHRRPGKSRMTRMAPLCLPQRQPSTGARKAIKGCNP